MSVEECVMCFAPNAPMRRFETPYSSLVGNFCDRCVETQLATARHCNVECTVMTDSE
jgi:hypothetical protein